MHTFNALLLCLVTGASIGAVKPADNPVCKMFSHAEIERYLGQAVAAIDHAGGGIGCQWIAKDEESNVIVSVFGSRRYVAPKAAKGFKPLPGIGSQGYVVPASGGWDAGAVVGDQGFYVSVTGTNKEAAAIALLEAAIKRHRPSPRGLP